MKTFILILAAAFLALAIAACGDDEVDGGASPGGLDPAEFTSTVDNPLFPLTAGDMHVYEGEEADPDSGETVAIRVESTVLAETDTAGGIEVTVVEVKDYEDGDLVESTLDYYAQHSDGTVYYMGERVDDYEDGEVVGHSGQWLAGEGENQAGIFMPADPQVGDEFEQERAPGIAEDQSKVVAVGESVTTDAGSFEDCVKTEDLDPIDDVTEFKYYCPGVGLVREEFDEGHLDLISYGTS